MEKRRYPRMALQGIVADISDGKGFFSGRVHDISRFGLSLNDIPKKIDEHALLTIIVDGRGGHFKLRMKPCWDATAGMQKIIGGEIEQTSFAWTEFVKQFEPASDDIWGNS